MASASRVHFYNYALQYKDGDIEKFCSRKEMIDKYKLTLGSIHQLLNDSYTNKNPHRRFKWKDFKIKKICERKEK